MNNLLLTVIAENSNRTAKAVRATEHKLNNVKLFKNPKTTSPLINKDNLSALDNFAKSKKSYIELEDLKNDLFDDTIVTVYSRNKHDDIIYRQFVTKLDDTTEKNFPEKIRELYKSVEKTFKDIYNSSAESYVRREIK